MDDPIHSPCSSDDDDDRTSRKRKFLAVAHTLKRLRPRPGPRGAKTRTSRPAFDWDEHVDDLSAKEFRKRYRMGLVSFRKLVNLCKPYLSKIDNKRAL